MGIVFDIINIVKRLIEIDEQTHICIGRELDELTLPTEEQLKKDAPWTDRTGNARRTLGCKAEFEQESNKFYFLAYGSMPYSPKLEFGYNLRYSILFPTIEAITPRFLECIGKAVNEQRGLSVE